MTWMAGFFPSWDWEGFQRKALRMHYEVFNPRVGRPDPWLLGAVLALCSLGLVMVWSASHMASEYNWGSRHRLAGKQFVALTLGLAGMYVASRMRIRWLRNHINWILGAAFALLGFVFILGQAAGGAQRWLPFGSFSFQPSELAKLAVVLYVARAVALDPGRAGDFIQGFLKPLAVTAIVAAIILMQRDLSTAVIVCAVAVLMVFAAGARLRHMMLLVLVAGAAVGVGVQQEMYRMDRIQGWLKPEEHLHGVAWQLYQSQLGIASGGLVGVGLGQGEQKTGYLPEIHTDFIFTLVAEELGVVGALAVMAIFVLLGWRGWLVAVRHPDPFSSMLAFGLTSLLVVQAVLHVGVGVGLFPTTGLVLPFVSYGGSAMVVMLLEVGILVALSRMSG